MTRNKIHRRISWKTRGRKAKPSVNRRISRKTRGRKANKKFQSKRNKTKRRILIGGVKPFDGNLQRRFTDDSQYGTMLIKDIMNPDIVLSIMKALSNSQSFIFVILADENDKLYLMPEGGVLGGDGYGHSSFFLLKNNASKYLVEQHERAEALRKAPEVVAGMRHDLTGYYTQGDTILYAGTIEFDQHGNLLSWSNNSGHFRPPPINKNVSTDYEINHQEYNAMTPDSELNQNLTSLFSDAGGELDYDKFLNDLGIPDLKNKLEEHDMYSIIDLLGMGEWEGKGWSKWFGDKGDFEELFSDIFKNDASKRDLIEQKRTELESFAMKANEITKELEKNKQIRSTLKQNEVSKMLSDIGMPLDKYVTDEGRWSSALYVWERSAGDRRPARVTDFLADIGNYYENLSASSATQPRPELEPEPDGA